VLNYGFMPKGTTGSCPCTPASQPPVTTASYTAVASTVQGSKKGQAALYWNVMGPPQATQVQGRASSTASARGARGRARSKAGK
jgi:hypothetical protein